MLLPNVHCCGMTHAIKHPDAQSCSGDINYGDQFFSLSDYVICSLHCYLGAKVKLAVNAQTWFIAYVLGLGILTDARYYRDISIVNG